MITEYNVNIITGKTVAKLGMGGERGKVKHKSFKILFLKQRVLRLCLPLMKLEMECIVYSNRNSHITEFGRRNEKHDRVCTKS